MTYRFAFGRDARVNALLGAGHFLSHFYQLCLPPLFIAWQQTFDVSFAELGLAMAVMAGAAAVMQTPMGFLVDRYGARPFLVGGTLLMTLSIAAMGLATAYWQVVGLALLSGIGNSVFHPADYAILSGSVDRAKLGRSFAFHTFTGHVGFAAAPPATAALMLLLGWRGALLFIGLLGIPVVAAILWQSRILTDQARQPRRRAATPASGRETAAEPLGADVLRFLHGVVDGRGGDPILADHDPPPGARTGDRGSLFGLDRVHGRHDRRRADRRLGRRPHRPASAVRHGPDRRCRGAVIADRRHLLRRIADHRRSLSPRAS